MKSHFAKGYKSLNLKSLLKMFGVVISYLPNFNVGQENGMANATGSWNNGTASAEEKKRGSTINVF